MKSSTSRHQRPLLLFAFLAAVLILALVNVNNLQQRSSIELNSVASAATRKYYTKSSEVISDSKSTTTSEKETLKLPQEISRESQKLRNRRLLDDNNGAKKFLLLHEANEGISKWIYIVHEMFNLAAQYRRTLVEPCVLDARLSSCLNPAAFPLSEVIAVDLLSGFYKVEVIPFRTYLDDYAVSTGNSSVMCASKTAYSFDLHRLSHEEQTLQFTSQYNFSQYSLVEASHEYCLQNYKDTTSVIFFSPWIHSLMFPKSPRKQSPPSLYTLMLPRNIEFVDSFLSEVNIDLFNFVTVGWRSETVQEEHMLPCTEELMNVAKQFNIIHQVAPDRFNFALISDISYNPNSTLWWGQRHKAAKDESLAHEIPYILERMFVKIEISKTRADLIGSAPMFKDLVFSTIWDIILAVKSKMFISCIDASRDKPCPFCCRTDSHFLRLIMDLRLDLGRPSYTSWLALRDTNIMKKSEYLYSDVNSFERLDSTRYFNWSRFD